MFSRPEQRCCAKHSTRTHTPYPCFTIYRRTSPWQIHGKPLTSRALSAGTISPIHYCVRSARTMSVNQAREQMIEQQVRAWEVLDARVLALLRNVPREQFVPDSQRFLAFADVDVPLPHGQHMLRPNIVGRLLQALELSGTERVLEIGAGTGFVTACLSSASRHVKSFELFADLADTARTHLAAIGASNVEVVAADALQAGVQLEPAVGGSSRYHAIAVTGSLP